MKSLTKAGTRAVCAGLALLAAVGWSCTKQDEPAMNDKQTDGAIAQARSYYENTAPSLTKTVADQSIAIMPLPGDMTPQWDRATVADCRRQSLIATIGSAPQRTVTEI